MSDFLEQERLVQTTYKNGRVDFQINPKATQNITEGIIIGDLYGYISDVNEVCMKMAGVENKNELVGKHILEFLVKEEKARAIKSSLESIASNKEITQQYRVILKSGKQITLEVKTRLMKDESGENIGFIDFVKQVNV
jgi:two-component system NtrC family sensor kinase